MVCFGVDNHSFECIVGELDYCFSIISHSKKINKKATSMLYFQSLAIRKYE